MQHERSHGIAHSAYVDQDVGNESPLGLVARTYQIARLEARRARTAIAQKDWAAKGRSIHRLLRCLALLQGVLDLRRGGDVARNLDRIYTYLTFRVTRANLENRGDLLDEVETHLGELGAAWSTVANRSGQEAEVTAGLEAVSVP